MVIFHAASDKNLGVKKAGNEASKINRGCM